LQLLSGVPGKDADGEVRQPEHTDGQSYPQCEHRDLISSEQIVWLALFDFLLLGLRIIRQF
jgi:hypothetical protein